MLAIYRSERPQPEQFLPRTRQTIARAPANVPYLVDNLWEWKRPLQFPCRRFSVFASPTPEMALKTGPAGGRACRLELSGEFVIAQIRARESKKHTECGTLRKLLFSLLGQSWLEDSLEAKLDAGRLFIPCLSAAEVEHIFSRGPLRNFKDNMWRAIRYWEEATLIEGTESQLNSGGEVFFEADGWRCMTSR
jgi:hypothetical protein